MTGGLEGRCSVQLSYGGMGLHVQSGELGRQLRASVWLTYDPRTVCLSRSVGLWDAASARVFAARDHVRALVEFFRVSGGLVGV